MTEPARNHTAALQVGRLLLVGAMLAIGLAQSARADTTYTYSGNNFTTFAEACGFGTCVAAGGDRLTGFFTLPSPLGADLGPTTISPTTFSFTDGVTTFDNNNFSPGFVFGRFQVETNDSGDIATVWDIEATQSFTGFGFSTVAGLVPLSLDGDTFAFEFGCNPTFFQCFSFNIDNPGFWTVTTTASGPPPTTPEPTTFLLLSTGLLGLAPLLRKRFAHLRHPSSALA